MSTKKSIEEMLKNLGELISSDNSFVSKVMDRIVPQKPRNPSDISEEYEKSP